MTDEQIKLGEDEIIKALECCKDLKCSECPKKANLFMTDCDVKLCDEVLDLITRQKSELAELNNLLKLSNDIQNEFIGKIDEQKAEIERLTTELVGIHGAANSYKMHYDKSQAENKELWGERNRIYASLQETKSDLEEYRRAYAKAKSEAIKEFAERLKKEYRNFDKLNEIIQIENLFLCIDDLAKEMTEIIP